jgi:hypothetical protein
LLRVSKEIQHIDMEEKGTLHLIQQIQKSAMARLVKHSVQKIQPVLTAQVLQIKYLYAQVLPLPSLQEVPQPQTWL